MQSCHSPSPAATCRLHIDRVECDLPATRAHLKITVSGSAPIYLWSRELRKGTNDLGTLALKAGGSVTGWIARRQGDPAGSELSIRLYPGLAGLPSPKVLARRPSMAVMSPASDEGFFQVVGLAAGFYSLEVRSGAAVLARQDEIVVDEGRETLLPQPLECVEPVRLEVSIVPPVDPRGEAWIVRLSRMLSADSLSVEDISRVLASASGTADLGKVEAGRYVVQIVQADSSPWAEVAVSLGPGETSHFIPVWIPVIEVTGILRRGKHPLQAELRFGEHDAAGNVTLESDEDGRFEGYLPRAGRWKVGIHPLSEKERRVHLKLRSVEIRRPLRGPARVEIVLPDSRLEGRVVTREGKVVGSARLTVWRNEGSTQKLLATAETDQDGRFRLDGLPEGPAMVEAVAPDGSASEAVAVSLSEEIRPLPLELVLGRRLRLRGRVTVAGTPVPGASVVAWPRSFATLHGSRSPTDQAGEFRLEIAGGLADFLVFAPGQKLWMARLDLDPERTEPLNLELGPEAGSIAFTIKRVDVGEAEGVYLEEIMLVYQGAVVALKELLPFAQIDQDTPAILFPRISPGNYSLCTPLKGCTPVVLAPHGEERITLTVIPSLELPTEQ